MSNCGHKDGSAVHFCVQDTPLANWFFFPKEAEICFVSSTFRVHYVPFSSTVIKVNSKSRVSTCKPGNHMLLLTSNCISTIAYLCHISPCCYYDKGRGFPLHFHLCKKNILKFFCDCLNLKILEAYFMAVWRGVNLMGNFRVLPNLAKGIFHGRVGVGNVPNFLTFCPSLFWSQVYF